MTNGIRLVLCVLAAVVFVECGGAKVAVEGSAPKVEDQPATVHYETALSLVAKRDIKSALVQAKAALSKDDNVRYRVALAHLTFLSGDVAGALSLYRALAQDVELNERARKEFADEVKRLEKTDEAQERSLAGAWKRAEPARLQAEKAVSDGAFTQAYQAYDKAYQYNGDVDLLFESALCASKASDWAFALKKFKQYMAVGAGDIPKDLAYRITAEIDRIKVILKAGVPVTNRSLADEVFAERAGVEETDGLPPSMVEASVEAPVDQSVIESDKQVEDAVAEEAQKVLEEVPIAASTAQKAAADKKAAAPKARAEQKAERTTKQEAMQAAAKAKRAEVATQKAERARQWAMKKAASSSKDLPAADLPGRAGLKTLAQKELDAKKRSAFGAQLKNSSHQAEKGTSFEDLSFYAQSKSATVRFRAVHELAALRDDAARVVLEERVLVDRNLHVRLAAVKVLVERFSVASLPVLEHALITAATSQERAFLKNAIARLRGVSPTRGGMR